MEFLKQYTCDRCGRSFTDDDPDWGQAEADAEQAANGWTGVPDEDMARICDDCYKLVMAARN